MLAILMISSLLSCSVYGMEEITDGQTISGKIERVFGGSESYVFHLEELKPDTDLSISLTRYSDWQDPDLYVSAGQAPSSSDAEWKSTAWGNDHIQIPSVELQENMDYYIMIKCATYCNFYLTVSYRNQIELLEGIELVGTLSTGYEAKYIYTVHGSSEVAFNAVPISGRFNLYVSDQAFDDDDLSGFVEDSWDNGKYFHDTEVTEGQTFYVTVVALSPCKYSIVAIEGYNTVIELRASSAVGGVVEAEKMRYYSIEIGDPEADLTVQLTKFSGSPRFYIKKEEKPTIEDYDFKQADFEDTLVIAGSDREGSEFEKYFIGVYGELQSSYVIRASLSDNSFIEIVPGRPQSGSIDFNLTKHYILPIIDQSKDMNISVHLAPQSGNPDLYIQLCKEDNEALCLFNSTEITDPDSYGIKSSVHNTGIESIMLLHEQSLCSLSSSCNYVIGVHGASQERSVFSLTASENSTAEYILRDGHPMTMSIKNSSYLYFKYTVHNASALAVTFTLSPIAGDPDLYTARNYVPSMTHNEKKSRESLTRIDVVKYDRGIDSDSLVGDYHIAVHAFYACSFSIIAVETLPMRNSTIVLYPGHPQRDMLYNKHDGDYRIYSFKVEFTEETKQPITISLTPLTGTFDLYAANNPGNLDWNTESFFYDWRDNATSSEPQNIINIPVDDPYYRLNSTYLVVAMANSFTSNDTATYSIMVNIGSDGILLSEDVPFTDQALAEEYKHYRFPVYYTLEDVKITVTAISGDPDLYVSFQANNTKPNKNQSDFESSRFGGEVLAIAWEDGINKFCPDIGSSHGDASYCMAYISVYGFSAAHYTITVHASEKLPQQLLVGGTMTGLIEKADYDYFYSIISTNTSVTFDLQGSVGDPDLFVNLLDSGSVGSNATEWNRPSRTTYDYASQNSNLADQVNVETDKLREHCPSGECVAVIGIYCFSDNCGFTISTMQGSESRVLENEPKYGYVLNNEYVYYSYYCNIDDQNLMFSLTSINGEDPDLYIAKGRESKPTKENATWRSEHFGNDTVVISPLDSEFNGNSMRGTYVIGVRGTSGDVSFMLLVNNHPIPLIKLAQGVPSYNDIPANNSAYYYFYNTFDRDILINLTPQSGSAVMAVKVASSTDEDITKVYDNLPTLEDYAWSSETTNDQNLIRIYKNDHLFCTYCDFIIGVFTQERDCAYSITINNENEAQVLQNGVPVKGQMEKDNSAYYSFELLQKERLDIILSVYSGDLDLTARNGKTPESDFRWVSESGKEDKHIRIEADDPEFKIKSFIIEVEASSDCSYSIVAHTQGSYIKLVQGWPIEYSLKAEESEHVLFRYTGSASCTLKSLVDNYWPSLYVKFQEQGLSIPPPSAQYADDSYTFESYDMNYKQIFFELGPQESEGQYNLAVYSNTTTNAESSTFAGEFEIACSANYDSTIIETNVENHETLDKGTKKKEYQLTISKQGHLEVHVIPCAGKLRLTIRNELGESEPSVDETQLTGGSLRGILTNARAGHYYISVIVLKESSWYDIGSSYNIITIYAENYHDLSNPLVPGNYGILDLTSKHERIGLSWEPVLYNTEEPYDQQGWVSYSVYISYYSDVNFLSACGVYMAQAHGKAEIIDNCQNCTHSEFEYDPSKKMVLNVIAVVYEPSYNYLSRIPYSLMILEPNDRFREHGIGLILFWTVAGLFAVAAITAFCFWKKYKATRNRLEFEMSDVRVIAASVSSGQLEPRHLTSRQQPYENLAS